MKIILTFLTIALFSFSANAEYFKYNNCEDLKKRISEHLNKFLVYYSYTDGHRQNEVKESHKKEYEKLFKMELDVGNKLSNIYNVLCDKD